MIQICPEQTIHVYEAMRILNVSRRRIYEVVNILDAVGFVDRTKRNVIRWIVPQEATTPESYCWQ